MSFEWTVAAIDLGSPSSHAVLAWARRIVPATGSIRVLHVIDTTALVGATQTPPSKVLGLQERLETEAEERLERIARAELRRDMRFVLDVGFGDPADEIVAVCENESVALAILGAHAHDTGDHLAEGSVDPRSVAEAVALRNPAPTMIVRDPPPSEPVARVFALGDGDAPTSRVLRVAEQLGARLGARLVAATSTSQTLAQLDARDLVVCGALQTLPLRGAPCPVVLVRPEETE